MPRISTWALWAKFYPCIQNCTCYITGTWSIPSYVTIQLFLQLLHQTKRCPQPYIFGEKTLHWSTRVLVCGFVPYILHFSCCQQTCKKYYSNRFFYLSKFCFSCLQQVLNNTTEDLHRLSAYTLLPLKSSYEKSHLVDLRGNKILLFISYCSPTFIC